MCVFTKNHVINSKMTTPPIYIYIRERVYTPQVKSKNHIQVSETFSDDGLIYLYSLNKKNTNFNFNLL